MRAMNDMADQDAALDTEIGAREATGSSANGDAAGEQMEVLESPRSDSTRLPRWAVVLLGASLAAILAIGGATLYGVSRLEDQATQTEQAVKVSKATKALLGLVAARQLRSADLPAQVEAAQQQAQAAITRAKDGMTKLQGQMTELQGQVVATQDLLIETQDTMNQLLTGAERAATTAQQSVATLRSDADSLRQNLGEFRATIKAELAEIRARLERLL